MAIDLCRYYFRCSRDRRCEAKKKVQQQDESRDDLQPPMFEVTYMNEHTCHVLRPITNNKDDDAARTTMASARATNLYRVLGVVDTARNDGSGDLFDPSFPRTAAAAAAQENETIVSCLATVISGGAVPSPSLWPPPAAAEAGAGDPVAYAPTPMPQAAGHSASVAEEEDGAATMTMIDDTDFSWDPSSSLCPVGEADHLMVDHRDIHVDVARLADTVWPRHTCGAWP